MSGVSGPSGDCLVFLVGTVIVKKPSGNDVLCALEGAGLETTKRLFKAK